jgi:O-succinylbenzoic acid--CoA ligase
MHREALIFEGRAITYGVLAERVHGLVGALGAAGIRPGEVVALLAPPSAEGVVLIHALLDLGVVMLPLNLRLTEGELAAAIESARASRLVISESTQALGEALAGRTGCGLLRLGAQPGGEVEFERLRVARAGEDHAHDGRREELRSRGGALVLFTSGTSGRPKGALLSLGNLRTSAEASIALLGSREGDRWLLCMPLFHIGGLSVLIRSALAGTSVALHRRFDAAEVDAALDRDGITSVSFVATMLERVLAVRGARVAPEALRVVLLGGGPVAQATMARALALGFPLAPTYGLTEAASQVATRPPTARVPEPSDLAAGLEPLPGVEIRVVDASGNGVPSGTVGEIEVRGPTVMLGYLDDPEATKRAIRSGWLATGDLGRIDAAGGLCVLDRRTDLILSGGENVYPAEIESVLVEHPDVDEAGVVGVEDTDFGQRPRAFVVSKEGREVDRESVLAHCRERLAGFKVPVDLVILDALPRTASGKLIRRDLGKAPSTSSD